MGTCNLVFLQQGLEDVVQLACVIQSGPVLLKQDKFI